MTTKTKEITVSKEFDELMVAVENIVKTIKTQLDDGWNVGMDLPPILMTAMTELTSAVDGANKMSEESKEDLKAFITTGVVGAVNIGTVFLPKK